MDGRTLQPLRREQPLRDRIHDRLRTAILSGELAPGTPVIEAELAARLGASRTPVREALRRLEAAGLLEPRGQRGSVVRVLAASEIEALFEIREALESLAARRAARAANNAVLRRVERHLAGMRAAIDDPNEMERHDTDFHDAIVAAGGSERLKRMLSDIREELIVHRFLSLSDPLRRRATLREHEAIVVALRAGDEAAAAARSAEHVAAVRETLLQRAALGAASARVRA
ncbi:MAG TPA: GntR family transcriptional regulator [Candidatus Sulfotelmatobacter sp.]|nr:GntR family transcriptional regulator [Candidatus Sulfotelmatobacter sp.]